MVTELGGLLAMLRDKQSFEMRRSHWKSDVFEQVENTPTALDDVASITN